MKIIFLVLLLFTCSQVRALVEMPEPITDSELPGIWHAINGNGIIVYRLKIEKDLSAVMLLSYGDNYGKGMDVFPSGNIINNDGYLQIEFSKSPTTYKKLKFFGKGISCKESSCMLVLRESEDSPPIWFYRKPLSELVSEISGAERVFERSTL